MPRQYYGVLSVLIFLFAFLIGFVAIYLSSPIIAFVFVGISLVCILIFTYAFCSKCPCKDKTCGHIIFGLLTKILPPREVSKYSKADLIAVTLPFVVMVLFPQYWLIENIKLLISFWLALAMAIVLIPTRLCINCSNCYCPILPKKSTHKTF